ncbi:MAG: peptidase A22B, signal peptide peptidase, partial [Benniella sp.]
RKTVKRQIHEAEESDEPEEGASSELVSLKDAYLLPVFGSLALYGLFIATTEWDRTIINYALTAYFGIMGALATAQVGVIILTAVITLFGIKLDYWHIRLIRTSHEFYTARFSVVHLFMLPVSAMLSAYYVGTKNWVASNLLAFSFALSTVQMFTLESFKTGVVLMSGMFAYDVYWSNKPEILNVILKNFDLPIKVVFPRLLLGLPAGQAFKFVSLGLGDIVVPGLFAALCLRFDQQRAGVRNPELGRSTQFRKPYFIGCIVAYTLGLGSMFAIHHITRVTLPALLFLTPACVLSVFMSAAVRGELQHVFQY